MTFTPETLAAFVHASRSDRLEIVSQHVIPTMVGDAHVVVYRTHGLYNSITERMTTILPGGGGGDIIVGHPRGYDHDLMRADDARREAERKAKACKHKKTRLEEGYACTSCSAFGDPVVTRECGSDGEFIADDPDERRCPTCNKFTSTVDSLTCPDCGDQDAMRPAKAEVCVACNEAVTCLVVTD